MLTVQCLLVELVSQFFLTINLRVYWFLVAGMHACTFTGPLCKLTATKTIHTQAETSAHTQAVTHIDKEAFLRVTWAVETCLTVEMSMPGQLAWGKWLRCCNAVNKIPCYLVRPIAKEPGQTPFHLLRAFVLVRLDRWNKAVHMQAKTLTQSYMKGMREHILNAFWSALIKFQTQPQCFLN